MRGSSQQRTSLRLLLDENVPRRLHEALISKGIDATTVQTEGLTGEENGKVVRHAVNHNRIIVTFDEDFLGLVNLDERVRVVRIAIPQRKAIRVLQKLAEEIVDSCSKLNGAKFVEITERQLGFQSSFSA